MKFAWLILSLLLSLAAASRSWCEGLKERLVLNAQNGAVWSLGFSPDGKTVATGGQYDHSDSKQRSGEIKLWDVQTGQERATLRGHASAIAALAFSPDGKLLATGAGDNAVKVWDLEVGKETLSDRSADHGVGCVAFSSDGKTLGYAGYQYVKLVNLATGKPISSFKRSGRVMEAAFSPDLKTIATPNHQDANLYDAMTGKERLILEDHRGGVSRLAFGADGKALAVASTRSEYPKYFGEVTLWDPATGQKQSVLKDKINVVRSLALSPDGKLLAVAGSKELNGQNELKLIDIGTGRDLAVLTAPKADLIWCLAFSPNGRLLAGGVGKTLMLWEVSAGTTAPK
jgi:WD40 repeat protein